MKARIEINGFTREIDLEKISIAELESLSKSAESFEVIEYVRGESKCY